MAAPSAQDRWNARYLAQAPGPAGPQPWLVEHQSLLPPTGLALDLAMGLGGSAGWLAERGWRAAGADISEIAVRRAKARWPALLAFVADLEHLRLPAAAFDLLLDFYYLDRAPGRSSVPPSSPAACSCSKPSSARPAAPAPPSTPPTCSSPASCPPPSPIGACSTTANPSAPAASWPNSRPKIRPARSAAPAELILAGPH